MKFTQGKQIGDNCYEKKYGRGYSSSGHGAEMEYASMETNDENYIIWYECGHVYIVKGGVCEQQFDYDKESGQ